MVKRLVETTEPAMPVEDEADGGRDEVVAKLREAMAAFFQRDLVEAEFFLPWAAQNLHGEIFATCKVLEDVERLREFFAGELPAHRR